MEKLILDVVARIRYIARYHKKIQPLVKLNPYVSFRIKGDEFVLEHICFSNGFNSLYVNNKEIWYDPSSGEKETLFKYKDLNDFLANY